PAPSAHATLHPAYQRQGRTPGPDRFARMGLCPLLRQLGAASARSSSLAAPVQLAPAARQPWLPTPDQPHPASTEQRPGFTHLARAADPRMAAEQLAGALEALHRLRIEILGAFRHVQTHDQVSV